MRARGGFTLVESVLAFTILSLGLLAAITMTQSGFLLSSTTGNGLQAEQILAQMLDLYSQDYVKYPNDLSYSLDPVTGPDQVVYSRQVTFSTYSNEAVAPVRQVRVKVKWTWKRRAYERDRSRLLCRVGR